MNSIINMLSQSQTLLKTKFQQAAFKKNFKEMYEISNKLFKNNKNYLIFTHIITKNEKELNLLLPQITADIELVLCLLKNDLCLKFCVTFLNSLKVKDYLYYLSIKELVIKDKIEYNLEILLDNLDDYSIYEFGLTNGKDFKQRDTMNYMYYLLHKQNDDKQIKKQTLIFLINKTKVYKDLEFLYNMIENFDNLEGIFLEIGKFLKFGYDKEICKTLYKNYSGDVDFLKLILGHLIESKKINNLIMALFLSKKYFQKFENNYEIDLIYLFLLKYFLFYYEILEVFNNMDIKNNLEISMSYIWSDVYLQLPNIKNSKKEIVYKLHLSEIKSIIEDKFFMFVEKNQFGHAIDLIDVFDKLNNDVVEKELIEKKILTTEKTTQFSFLLGSKCCYLFNKCTEKNNITLCDKPFNNDLEDIEDENFKSWFLNKWSLYH